MSWHPLNLQRSSSKLFSGKYFSTTEKERFYGDGMVDIIRICDGQVLKRISEFLHKELFSNPLVYLTDNWVAIKFGPKIPMYHLYEDKKIELNRCHVLSQDEKHFVLSQCHR